LTIRFIGIRLLLLCCLLPVARARAQAVAVWDGANDQWTHAAHWSTAPHYPDNGTPPGVGYFAAIGAGAVGLDTPVTVDGVTLKNAALNLADGVVLSVTGDFVSTGQVTAGTGSRISASNLLTNQTAGTLLGNGSILATPRLVNHGTLTAGAGGLSVEGTSALKLTGGGSVQSGSGLLLFSTLAGDLEIESGSIAVTETGELQVLRLAGSGPGVIRLGAAATVTAVAGAVPVDPIFWNTGGDIEIGGTVSGNGAPLAIISSGNITGTPGSSITSTSRPDVPGGLNIAGTAGFALGGAVAVSGKPLAPNQSAVNSNGPGSIGGTLRAGPDTVLNVGAFPLAIGGQLAATGTNTQVMLQTPVLTVDGLLDSSGAHGSGVPGGDITVYAGTLTGSGGSSARGGDGRFSIGPGGRGGNHHFFLELDTVNAGWIINVNGGAGADDEVGSLGGKGGTTTVQTTGAGASTPGHGSAQGGGGGGGHTGTGARGGNGGSLLFDSMGDLWFSSLDASGGPGGAAGGAPGGRGGDGGTITATTGSGGLFLTGSLRCDAGATGGGGGGRGGDGNLIQLTALSGGLTLGPASGISAASSGAARGGRIVITVGNSVTLPPTCPLIVGTGASFELVSAGGVVLQNSQTLEGEVRFESAAPLSHSGTMNILAGGDVVLASPAATSTGGINLSGEGHLRADDFTNGGAIEFGPGGGTLTVPELLNHETVHVVQQAVGSITSPGPLLLRGDGSSTVEGTLHYQSGSGDLTLRDAPVFTPAGGGSIDFTAGAAAAIRFEGNVLAAPGITLQGVTVTAAGDALPVLSASVPAGIGRVAVAGDVKVERFGTATASASATAIVDGGISAAGTANIGPGCLEVHADLTISGTVTVRQAGELRYGPGGGTMVLQRALNQPGAVLEVDGTFGPKTGSAVRAFQNQSGLLPDGIVGPSSKNTLRGTGTLTADVSNASVVAPGKSSGILTIDGDFTQTADGELHIELGGTTAGTGHDRLVVTGSASLAGGLVVTLIGGFTPQAGDAFDILDAAGITGGFTVFQLPALGPGLWWHTGELATTGTLRVIALSAIQQWRLAHFGSPDNSGAGANDFDPDHDGLPNLIEFAFGLDPGVPAVGPLPSWSLHAGQYTTFFATPAGIGGVVFSAEWSTTLAPGSWTVIPDAGSGGQHVFSVSAAADRMFFRLTVTAAP
jgi:peptidoglycan hydrolase-like protein with peptidoglycan-binding domain